MAVDAVNAPRDFMQSKALIAAHTQISTDKLADSTIPLKDMAAGA
ncbi:MAG: oxidoreductase C-terminal domain-containing protein [Woeseiaceae bacterium]